MKPLSDFAHDVTSYSGEDGIIEELFRRIGTNNMWCVEFGACDGRKGSNSWNLINKHDWHAVLIEADHRMAGDLKRLYASNTCVIALERFVRASGSDSLDPILDAAGIPSDPDLMIIDIDSYDYQIWASLERHRPRVVMIEYNEALSLELDWVQKETGPLTGSSLLALRKLGEGRGYRLVYAKNGNAIFADARSVKNLAQAHPDDIISSLPAYLDRTGRFVQAYDGSFVLFDVPFPEAIERRTKIYKDSGSQVHILDGERVKGIRAHSEPKWLRRSKDRLKSTWLAKACYPAISKLYAYRKVQNLKRTNS